MVINLYRLLTAINCLQKILDKAHFDTVILVHLNSTTDVADIVHKHLSIESNFIWIKYNMDHGARLQNQLLDGDILNKIFAIYVLDVLTDCYSVAQFVSESDYRFDHNHMYIVSQYSTEHLIYATRNIFHWTLYNYGILFWNMFDKHSTLAVYSTNGFERIVYRIATYINGQCTDDIYSQIFYNKLLNFHGRELTVYGETDPPKIVRTAQIVNGRHEISLGGYNVLIIETIVNHLNATANYKLMMLVYYEGYLNQSLETRSKISIY